MGEIATYNGERVKLGTCENMYYCRFDQRKDVSDFPGTEDNRYWRLPFPDEDGTSPGHYESFNVWRSSYHSLLKRSFETDMKGEDVFKKRGLIQTRIDALGMLVNVPCNHGFDPLPNLGDGKAFWNGKTFPIRLRAVYNDAREHRMMICVGCAACGEYWLAEFNEIEKYIVSIEMRMRLFKLCQEYWEECHDDWEQSGYAIADILNDKEQTEIVLTVTTFEDETDWAVYKNRKMICNGDFDDCSSVYRSLYKNQSIED